jgi:leader peptidase (prepilin peptidase) / N-methyltransferase
MLIGVALLWMSALCGFDVTRRRLPNWLTVPGAGAIVIGALVAGHVAAALVGGTALATVYLLVHLLSPAAMGAGDVKLALGLGALTGCFGISGWLLAALAAPVLTIGVGIVARIGWSAKAVPHGPSMCVASAVAFVLT